MIGEWFAQIEVPRTKLWDALTQSEHLDKWFDSGARLELQEGGRFSLPGGTQFRGSLGDVQLKRFTPNQQLTFSWPVNGVPTELALTLEDTGRNSTIRISQKVLDESKEMFPPRGNWGVLRHYWKQNLASLKYYLELDRAPSRTSLQGRNLKEVNLSFVYSKPMELVWSAITDPKEMDQWISKKAMVDLRTGGKITYAWDHGADQVVEVQAGRFISYTWINDGDKSLVSWRLTPVTQNQTRLDFRHSNFSEKAPQRPTGYNEGWFTFLLILGLYLERGAKTPEWSNLNDDPNS